ncbi:hypothetical protein ACNFBT_03950 [Pseudomonas sp. NY15181]|uniref:hypothetical protein n=1 Tax=Pseudomonas sp. NY15181 TaxID=3400349 RepID=UPI003A8812B3
MSASQLMILKSHLTLRLSAVPTLRAFRFGDIRTPPNGWEASQHLRQSAGVGNAIPRVRRPKMDDLTFLRPVVQESRIKVMMRVSANSSKLCQATLHLTVPHKPQILGSVEKSIHLLILEEKVSSYIHADIASISSSLN